MADKWIGIEGFLVQLNELAIRKRFAGVTLWWEPSDPDKPGIGLWTVAAYTWLSSGKKKYSVVGQDKLLSEAIIDARGWLNMRLGGGK